MKRLLRPNSIRSKLTLYLLAVFVMLSVRHWRTYHLGYEDRQKLVLATTRQDNNEAARFAAAAMANLTYGAERVQMAAGQSIIDHRLSRSSINSYLQAICRTDRNCLSCALLSPTGKIVAGSRTDFIGADLSLREDVRSVIRTTKPSVSDLYIDKHGRRCFAVNSAIVRNGRLRGTMRTEFSAAALSGSLPPKQIKGMIVAILDPHGSEVYESGSQSFGLSSRHLRQMPFVRNSLRNRSFSDSTFKMNDGSRCVGCAVPVSGAGWAVVAVRPVEDGFKQAETYFRRGFLGSLGYTAFLLVIFWWLCGVWITGNLRRFARAAAAIAVGDLGKRIHVKTGDELERLANAFNRMAASLQSHERQIQGKSAALEGLLDVSRVVTSSLDLNTVIDAISQAAHRRYEAAAVAVYLPDDNYSTLDRVAYNTFGLNGPDSPPASWDALAVQAHRSGRIELTDSNHAAGLWDTAVPLVAADKPAGVLVAALGSEASNDEESRSQLHELLLAFGSHAAVGLQNAKAYARAEEYSKSLAAWLDELSALRYVAEAITASLDLSEVLRTLARLTCDVMKAKSCGIMMMDAGGQLSVNEAHGLSPAMFEDCVCRIGEPVAGLAAAEKRPVTCTDLCCDYPLLPMAVTAANEGLRGFLSVPLIFDKEVLGTIDIWMQEPHEFTAYQIDLLSSIAAHAAMVIQNARLFGKEYKIAETLQNVILGNIPDELSGLELGCKYAPAMDEAHVGGDFYDAFSLPGGRLGVVVADVSGKGLEAAMHTAMCKYMLRGFAYHWPDSPGRTLELLNEALSGFAASRFYVTVFYCVIEPATGRMIYANAGHPPAVWISDSGLRQVLLYQTGMPVGMDVGLTFGEKSVTLEPEDMLIMYTDGVMEARRDTETLGIEGLQEILFAAAGERDPKALVELLHTETLRYAGAALRDDIAIIALRAYEVGPFVRSSRTVGETVAESA